MPSAALAASPSCHLVSSLSAALAASRAYARSQQRLALTMSEYPGFADKNPWVMKAVNAAAHELQCWYL
jgi:hypothetical protein